MISLKSTFLAWKDQPDPETLEYIQNWKPAFFTIDGETSEEVIIKMIHQLAFCLAVVENPTEKVSELSEAQLQRFLELKNKFKLNE